MTKRYYLPLALALVPLCLVGLLYLELRPCPSCEAVEAMSARLGVEPDRTSIDQYFRASATLVSIDQYLRQELIKGKTKEQVFALLDKAKPDSVVIVHNIGSVRDVSDAVCYYVAFDTTLNDLLLNRYLCFDGNNKLILVFHELSD